MAGRLLERIQSAITRGAYDLTFHAIEEMAEDDLDIYDIEAAIMNGSLAKIETDDLRGSRYTIMGVGVDGYTVVGVVGRFKETGVYLIITAYEVN